MWKLLAVASTPTDTFLLSDFLNFYFFIFVVMIVIAVYILLILMLLWCCQMIPNQTKSITAIINCYALIILILPLVSRNLFLFLHHIPSDIHLPNHTFRLPKALHLCLVYVL